MIHTSVHAFIPMCWALQVRSKAGYLAGSSGVINAVEVGMGQTGLGSRPLLGRHLQQGPAPKTVTSHTA